MRRSLAARGADRPPADTLRRAFAPALWLAAVRKVKAEIALVIAREVDCDIAVIGGSMGGVAAAVAAARAGYRVCLTEQTAWLGGQCTSQGVSALDEHAHIEQFGGTGLYYEFRNRIRAFYSDNYTLSQAAAGAMHLNPGAGWVSRLCFEPRAALAAILDMILPLIQEGRLEVYYQASVCGLEQSGGHIIRILLEQPAYNRRLSVRGAYFLDATDLGELLPVAGLPYAVGAESRDDTGEPHAREGPPAPALAQTFTFPFVVDYRPGENHTIPKPVQYEHNREHQPYTLTLRYGSRDLTYKMFQTAPELPGPFWTYRRILAAANFAPGQFEGDLAMVNWAGNDFHGGTIIDAAPHRRHQLLQNARHLALGLLYWLQTEVPRDKGGGHGYPELRLRHSVLGTADGLSQYPYVRESRRIRALTRVREQDVMAEYQQGARAALFGDSVGVGWYPVDIHGQPGDTAATGPTRPFQIPLGAFVQNDVANLLPACKNLGVTHITNGCYRLHPVEWNTGEVAGRLAVHCLQRKTTPGSTCEVTANLRRFQRDLLTAGVPLFWYPDLPAQAQASGPAQLLAVSGLWPVDGHQLNFGPDAPVRQADIDRYLRAANVSQDQIGTTPRTRGELAQVLAAECLNWHGD